MITLKIVIKKKQGTQSMTCFVPVAKKAAGKVSKKSSK